VSRAADSVALLRLFARLSLPFLPSRISCGRRRSAWIDYRLSQGPRMLITNSKDRYNVHGEKTKKRERERERERQKLARFPFARAISECRCRERRARRFYIAHCRLLPAPSPLFFFFFWTRLFSSPPRDYYRTSPERNARAIYKLPLRPIVVETSRARILSGNKSHTRSIRVPLAIRELYLLGPRMAVPQIFLPRDILHA